MRDNPYKDLPPLERKPDGSLYRMTPAQKKQAASLIRRECCCLVYTSMPQRNCGNDLCPLIIWIPIPICGNPLNLSLIHISLKQ